MEPTATLDGNAAAGLLAELFRVDLTTANARCAGCGAEVAVAALAAYAMGMGAVLRCRGCDTVVLRVSRTGDRLWLDLRGCGVLRVDLGA